MSPRNLTALIHQPPNPAFKRTRTGGAGLWVFLALRAGAGRLTQALGTFSWPHNPSHGYADTQRSDLAIR